MTPVEIQVKINIAQREADLWRDILKRKSCKDCANFDQGGCKLADGITPPPEVQAVGCDSWKWDEIPFN